MAKKDTHPDTTGARLVVHDNRRNELPTDQIVRKIKKRKPNEEKLPGSPRRSLRPRHKKINYHLPSSDDEDMTNSKLPPKSIGFLCVSVDP